MARRPHLVALGLGLTCALSACGGGGRANSASSRVAPYLDVAVSSPSQRALVQDSGIRELTLGFVVAARNRCQAGWDGGLPLADQHVTRLAALARPVVSFGGRDGPDLAQRCGTATALAAQYERALASVDAQHADFDVEQSDLNDRQATARRSLAIAMLQASARRNGRRVLVSLTLPADPTGLSAPALEVVRSALNAGVRVSEVNLLAMDFGDSYATTKPGRMARYIVATATRSAGQLRGLLRTGAGVWPMIGITAMIGRNDVGSELFTGQDAADVVRFASAHDVGFLSFWSLSRDRSCPPGVDPRVEQETCSGLGQPQFSFTREFANYRGQ